MKKHYVLIAFLISSGICAVFYFQFTSIIKNRKKHLGEKYILQKDTIQILGCSWWDNAYLMSNGQKIDFNLVEKLPQVK